jgi:hypothetical protein
MLSCFEMTSMFGPTKDRRAGWIKRTASHRCQIFSFEQEESCDSFPGARQRHPQHQRAPCIPSVPVRSHRAAFLHIRQKRCFCRFENVSFLQRFAQAIR